MYLTYLINQTLIHPSIGYKCTFISLYNPLYTCIQMVSYYTCNITRKTFMQGPWPRNSHTVEFMQLALSTQGQVNNFGNNNAKHSSLTLTYTYTSIHINHNLTFTSLFLWIYMTLSMVLFDFFQLFNWRDYYYLYINDFRRNYSSMASAIFVIQHYETAVAITNLLSG